MKNIEEIKNQTYALIDDLKKTTTENGLAGSGNEYVVIVEIFLYKFLNDKFIYEAKKEKPELANAEDFFAALDAMSEDDYVRFHARHNHLEKGTSYSVPCQATERG